MAKISAVIFDLDGVLVDATEWHYEALNRALGLFGYTINRYEHLSSYNGLPTARKLKMLSVEKGLPFAMHGLIKELKQKYTREEIFTMCHPSFEKEMMVRNLKREGYKLAVCSNAVCESVEMMLHCSALISNFEFYIGTDDVSKPKPDPEMYLLAFDRMGISPEQAVIVEDAGPGIEAAYRSGAHVCQVSGFSEVDYYRVRSSIDKIEQQSK